MGEEGEGVWTKGLKFNGQCTFPGGIGHEARTAD